MKLERLFHIQNALDQKIRANHELEGTSLVPQKLLALQVELGELANETRCFKFWSLKPASEKSVILEEYVDGLHFIFSIGLDLSFDRDVCLTIGEKQGHSLPTSGASQKGLSNEDVTDDFLNVYIRIAAFHQTKSLEIYLTLFLAYLHLGQALGFEWSDIERAYLEKNEVNHQRQEDGY